MAPKVSNKKTLEKGVPKTAMKSLAKGKTIVKKDGLTKSTLKKHDLSKLGKVSLKEKVAQLAESCND